MTLEIIKPKPVNSFLKGNSLIYGDPKSGKTTFAATINKGKGVWLLATEKGYGYLDEKDTDVIVTDIVHWEQMREVAQHLDKNPDNIQLLVVDTVDRLWRKCEAFAVKKLDEKAKEKIEHVSDAGYGKGTSRTKEEFDKVVNGLNQMGFPICFLSHSKSAEKDGIQKTGTSLSPAAETIVAGLCDFVFYLHITGNKRVFRTKPNPMFLGGDRSGRLPELIEPNYDLIQNLLAGKTVGKQQQLESKNK